MKHPNKKEQLMDAMGLLDETTVRSCLESTPRAARTIPFSRRTAVGIAASFAAVLMCGGLVALPLMMKEAPMSPTLGTGTPSEDVTPTVSSPILDFSALSYRTSNVVSVQKLSTAEPSGESGSTNSDISEIDNLSAQFFRDKLALSFDCLEGETVTVTSSRGGLCTVTYPEGFPADASTKEQTAWLAEHSYSLTWASILCTGKAVLNQNDRHLLWSIPTDAAISEGLSAEEDVVEFIIRDNNGNITGAGSILLSKHHLTDKDSYFYEKASQVRSTVLGSVCFDDPSLVTETAVRGYLDSLRAGIPTARDSFSYEAADEGERYMMAFCEILEENYTETAPNEVYLESATGYSFYTMSVTDRKLEKHHYLLKNDGTWGEIELDSYFDIWVPFEAREHAYSYTLTDGSRVLLTELKEDLEAGVMPDLIGTLFDITWSAEITSNMEVLNAILADAREDIIATLYPEADDIGLWKDNEIFSGGGSLVDVGASFMELYLKEKDGTRRSFLVFRDGSWVEIASDEGWIYKTCEGCDHENHANGKEHKLRVSRRITYSDGRVVEIQLQDYDGEMLWGPVVISSEEISA